MESFLQGKPRCLSAFGTTRVRTGLDIPSMAYRVSCNKCGGNAFGLEQLNVGESAVGINLVCESCKLSETVFDGTQHGYDGELGNTEHITGERSREKLHWQDGSPRRHDAVFVVFIYNIEDEELLEIAKDTGIATTDLFDWINIVEEDAATGETMWDYECA